jgi:hypothetical protein
MQELNICLQGKGNILNVFLDLREKVEFLLSGLDVTFEKCLNIPHVSLYQMNYRGRDIKLLHDKLEQICNAQGKILFTMDAQLDLVGKNIFWRSQEALENQQLQNLLNHIVDYISPLRSSHPMGQIREKMNALSLEEKRLVEKYGVYWGLPHNFNPHITLAYNVSRTDKAIVEALKTIRVPEGISFLASELCLGSIGYHGNLESSISTYSFATSPIN